MDRRKFLKTTAAGGALLTISVAPQGCGNDVSAAPLAKVTTNSDPTVPIEIREAIVLDNSAAGTEYGTLRLLVEFYPDLAKPNGAITLQLGSDIMSTNTRGYAVPPDNTILVINQQIAGQPQQFLAVQSSCPHAACPLGYNAKATRIECPCHASRFFATGGDNQCIGAVEHPPARAGLQRWNVTSIPQGSGTVLRIDLKDGLPCDCAVLPPAVTAGAGVTVTLPFAQFPALMMPGGSVCGQSMGVANQIIVTRLDAGRAVAVNSTCTHAGCIVAWNGTDQEYDCPCHGSVFAPDGAVKVGPATRPLTSYSVAVNADSLVVTIM